mmetsp:Transcript_26903/g.68356  ORF Transcript_26903/g.68356 Transcript_26903/m.68356 type:complete len:227 (+) Transcript_26903:141-821(+)
MEAVEVQPGHLRRPERRPASRHDLELEAAEASLRSLLVLLLGGRPGARARRRASKEAGGGGAGRLIVAWRRAVLARGGLLLRLDRLPRDHDLHGGLRGGGGARLGSLGRRVEVRAEAQPLHGPDRGLKQHAVTFADRREGHVGVSIHRLELPTDLLEEVWAGNHIAHNRVARLDLTEGELHLLGSQRAPLQAAQDAPVGECGHRHDGHVALDIRDDALADEGSLLR